MSLFVFRDLYAHGWFCSLLSLDDALGYQLPKEAKAAYAELFSQLLNAEKTSLAQALAHTLLSSENPLNKPKTPSPALQQAALYDLGYLQKLAKKDYQNLAQECIDENLPPLAGLPNKFDIMQDRLESFSQTLLTATPKDILEKLISSYRHYGSGFFAEYSALSFNEGQLNPIKRPVDIDMSRLIGLEKELKRLKDNTEAFLAGQKAHHALLYGMRGSGKSTAVRSLLPLYQDRGLKIIELHPQELKRLPELSEKLHEKPFYSIIFVDDLAFEQNDTSYQPLKTLLEGSLSSQPEKMLVYATSNRRHLIKENFKDRPDPLDDDVHKWDSHNEKLALSDRFGLSITFPNANQSRYLSIVQGLLEYEGIKLNLDQDDSLRLEAIRFAEWGNGYSGRTAQQFINQLKNRLA
ncbi:MAG: ATP-binding protein [Deinococcales bacterium]